MKRRRRKKGGLLPVPNRLPRAGTFPAPLALPDGHWRSRWLVTAEWDALHRISEIEWDSAELIAGKGKAVCGQEGLFHMPGIFGRMGLARCAACCEGSQIPLGEGNPFNAGIRESAAA